MKTINLTQDEVRSLLEYNPDTGRFKWRAPRGKANRSDNIGSPSKHGYLRIGINGKVYYAHRLAWVYVHGAWPNEDVDHINGNVTDNRIENLRAVSHAANSQNVKRAFRHSGTGLLGAHRAGAKFSSRIAVGGENRYLGRFDTAEGAHTAYINAKREFHQGNTL